MITGASHADVVLVIVPANGNFITAIAKGKHKAEEIPGQTCQHSRLINLLGVEQINIGVNKNGLAIQCGELACISCCDAVVYYNDCVLANLMKFHSYRRHEDVFSCV